MNLLLIDSGNTRIKWRHVDGQWNAQHCHGNVPHAEAERLTDEWRGIQTDRVLIANVAGATRLDALRRVLGDTLPHAAIEILIPARTQGGITNAYAQPQQLGADRWAGLIAAHALHPQTACLIVSLGTATTIDVLHADGQFAGGVILPGIATMRQSLANSTAQLPYAEGHYVAIADNTNDAIESGILHAQAGAIERVWRAQEVKRCILTGGHAQQVAPLLPFTVQIEDQLVLRGLYEVAYSIF